MTKLRNKIVLVLLALCLVACMGITVACGGDGDDGKKSDNKPVTYTVTVQMDGTAVKDVKVTVKKGTVSFTPKTTGDDGKVEFSLIKSDDYTVELDDLPENYEVPEGTTLTFPANRNLTVNIAEKFAYKIKLVNKDGDPFTMEGVTVGVCTLGGNCLDAVAPDASGLARIEATKGDYHIKVYGLPAGYAYECDSEGYSMHQSDEGTYIEQGAENTYNSLSATKNEQEITIYQVDVLDFAKMTAMTEDEIAEYNDWSRTIQGAKAYKVQAEIPAGETAYYTFNAECTGTYRLYAISYQSVSMGYKINPRFLLGDTVASGSGLFSEYGQNIDTTKGNQYYINVTNKTTTTKLELEFILATPVASVATATGAGTANVTLYRENATALIELKPTIGAAFKATVQGDTVAAIAFSPWEISENEMFDKYYAFYEEDSFGTGKYCEFKFTEDKIGGSVYLAVCAKAETYPVTVSVQIEKTRDIANIFNTVTTEDTLKKYNRPQNKELVPLPFDIDCETELVKGEDGYYYYDDKIVMVMITGDLDMDRFSAGGALVYMELSTNGRVSPYVVLTDSDDYDLTKGNTYDDYRELLRGFKDYKYNNQNNPSKPSPDDILVEKYYANPDFVNEDGAYPLTDELIDILKIITEQINEDNGMMLPEVDNYDNLWMFACYYYDDYLDPDAIAGEYKFVKSIEWGETKLVGGVHRYYDMDANQFVEATYTEDDYKLVVNKRSKFAIYQLNNEDEYEAAQGNTSGNWTKDEENDVYTFVVPDLWGGPDYNYSVFFNATTGRLALVNGEDGTVWIFQKGGANKLSQVLEDEDGLAMLEVYDNDTFKLYIDNVLVASGTHKPNADGSQIAIAVTKKEEIVSAVTIAYDDGIYSVDVDGEEYQVLTDKAPLGALLTEDGNAMLKLYNGAFKFYLKNGEQFVQYAYGTVGGEDEENPEIELIEKHETVKDAQVAIDIEFADGTRYPTKYDIIVTVISTNNAETRYVFDMLPMIGSGEEEPEPGEDITGLYQMTASGFVITLSVNADYTYTVTSDAYNDSGFWNKVDGEYWQYEFFVYDEEDNATVYAVFVNDGGLDFYLVNMGEMSDEPTYQYLPVGDEEQDEDEDGTPDFATLYSTQMLSQDETIAQAKLGLWNNGDCVLWQFNSATQTYVKIATANWGANQEGTEVTIANVTVMEGYEFTITTDYNVDGEQMVGVISITLHQGEDEDETTTPYTFYMPLQA